MKYLLLAVLVVSGIFAKSGVVAPSKAVVYAQGAGGTTVMTALPANAPRWKANWIWDTGLIVREKDNVISFMKANGVNLVYLQIDPSIDAALYKTFIRESGLSGTKVYALSGDPHWVLSEQRFHITDTVSWVQTFNAAAAEGEKFAGIQMDIEPYLLPVWNTDRDAMIRNWMDAITLFVAETRKTSGLTASAALPFWLDTLYVPGTANNQKLHEWMIGQLDQAALMSYRNFAAGEGGILDLVKEEIASADQLGKQIIVGVETLPNTEASYLSFYVPGAAKMQQELSVVDSSLNGHIGYAGYAVHDYAGWRVLLSR